MRLFPSVGMSLTIFYKPISLFNTYCDRAHYVNLAFPMYTEDDCVDTLFTLESDLGSDQYVYSTNPFRHFTRKRALHTTRMLSEVAIFTI